MFYLVTYDLNGENKGYSRLARAIVNASDGEHCWVCESSWLIRSRYQSAKEVYNKIKSCLDSDDECLVIGVTDNMKGSLPKNKWDKIQKIFS